MKKRVEITLLIDSDGRWSAAGSHKMEAKVSREVASDDLFNDLAGKQADEVAHCYHVVEVWVPVPEATDTKLEGRLKS